jgi:hypothetical protein
MSTIEAIDAITTAARDYAGGWFDGDAVRMERALHRDLAKRSPTRDDAGRQVLEHFTAEQMIGWTKEGVGCQRDPADRDIEITVHDVHDDIAAATCRCALYVDYLQLVRTDRGWEIADVLWAPR